MQLVKVKNLPESGFATSEAINQLRVNLGLCGKDIRAIMITSSVPNEGKSYISTQLWQSMADSGAKVLLIDCDLRNSTMRTKYGLRFESENYNIVDVLSGQAPLDNAVYRTNINNAYILPMTNWIPNPARLLENGALKQVIERCKTVFDYVIVDTPPVNTVADALNIAAYCDGSVLVIRNGFTSKKIVKSTYQLLTRAGAPVLGTVLNRVSTHSRARGYYSKYGYRYEKYGYSYGNTKNKTK